MRTRYGIAWTIPLLSLALCAPLATAQELRLVADGSTDSRDLYCVVKHFDFDERPLGNYENTPMFWKRLRGPGLPAYASGTFDDGSGHDAPPSFKLAIQSGNVCYEYPQLDMTVVADSDYLVRGYVRAEEIVHSRAFFVAFFVDRFDERIAGSERISELVASTGQSPEPWQRVEVTIPGSFPSAYALRLQLWILHTYAWQSAAAELVDPIYRRDVRGKAWFDDVVVYRVPRARLQLENASGVARAGEAATLLIELSSVAASELSGDVAVNDASGAIVFSSTLSLAVADAAGGLLRDTSTSARVTVPPLEVGMYRAMLRVRAGDAPLLERAVRFAVAADLPQPQTPRPDFGVTFSGPDAEDGPALAQALESLGAKSIKLGVSLADGASSAGQLRGLGSVLRQLAEGGVECTGVVLPPGTDGDGADSVRRAIDTDRDWHRGLSPVLAHFGGALPNWQVGLERVELAGFGEWNASQVAQLRRQLQRFVSVPEMIVPQRLAGGVPAIGDVASMWVSPAVPSRDLPTALLPLADVDPARLWLHVDPFARTAGDAAAEAIDLTRRIALCAALRPGRIFVDAPFERSDAGGVPRIMPTELFLPVRTLFRFLSGRRPVAAFDMHEDATIILFSGPASSCIVAWTWRERPLDAPIELYAGPQAKAYDLLGRDVALEIESGRTRIPIGPAPLIIDGVDARLAQLQASYRMTNTFIQRASKELPPTIHLKNPYGYPIKGELVVTPPGGWDVAPTVVRFDLDANATLDQPLQFATPPRTLASTQDCEVLLRVFSPESAEMSFDERLSVGLRDIEVYAVPVWDGRTLRVEHVLRNRSARSVSFRGFCEGADCPRLEGMFIDVQPGNAVSHTYIYPAAATRPGTTLFLGVQEIQGERSLNQIVEVPTR